MPTDILLGDDGTVTIECTHLATRDTVSPGMPVVVRGDLKLSDRVLVSDVVNVEGTMKVATAVTIEKEVTSGAKLYSPFGSSGSTGPDVVPPPEKPLFDVFEHLRNRKSPFDLATELGMLRRAVLELEARIKKMAK